MVHRREFLAAAGTLLAAPLARAENSKPARARTIGYLGLESAPNPPLTSAQWRQRPFSMAFRKLGWIEGQNLVIERAYAETKGERLAGLAEELVHKRVEIIVTVASPEATVAAARATSTIPIVFISGVVWPVEQGLIDSYARPGRNVTGVTFSTGHNVSAKRMEFLREVAPAARRLAWLYPPDIQETVTGGRFDMTPLYYPLAENLGFELRHHFVYKSEDIDTAFNEILDSRAQAVTVGGSAYIYQARQRIAEFASRNRLPSAFLNPDYVEAGGLLSYTSDFFADVFPKGIAQVDRILRGVRPADLPVEQPTKFQLTVNLKTAKALGLTIPQSLLLRADRVID